MLFASALHLGESKIVSTIVSKDVVKIVRCKSVYLFMECRDLCQQFNNLIRRSRHYASMISVFIARIENCIINLFVGLAYQICTVLFYSFPENIDRAIEIFFHCNISLSFPKISLTLAQLFLDKLRPKGKKIISYQREMLVTNSLAYHLNPYNHTFNNTNTETAFVQNPFIINIYFYLKYFYHKIHLS